MGFLFYSAHIPRSTIHAFVRTCRLDHNSRPIGIMPSCPWVRYSNPYHVNPTKLALTVSSRGGKSPIGGIVQPPVSTHKTTISQQSPLLVPNNVTAKYDQTTTGLMIDTHQSNGEDAEKGCTCRPADAMQANRFSFRTGSRGVLFVMVLPTSRACLLSVLHLRIGVIAHAYKYCCPHILLTLPCHLALGYVVPFIYLGHSTRFETS